MKLFGYSVGDHNTFPGSRCLSSEENKTEIGGYCMLIDYKTEMSGVKYWNSF